MNLKRGPIGLDVVAFTPDWSLTYEENWQRYCEAYYRVYGEYPPSSVDDEKEDAKPALPPRER